MNYTTIAPLGLRTGHGTFETFYDNNIYSSLKDAENDNNMVIVDFVKDEDNVIHFQFYNVRKPKDKKYYRLNQQHFPAGVDVGDDQAACRIAPSLFDNPNPKRSESKLSPWDQQVEDKLKEQYADQILRVALPFFKRYTLRWLFYRRLPNMTFSKYRQTRCKHCKNGSGTRMMIFSFTDEKNKRSIFCVCGKPQEEEPNTNLNYLLYNIKMKFHKHTIGNMWKALSWVRIVRSSHHGRYDVFGDECNYIHSFILNMESGKTTFKHKKRVWWQYIFIEKPNLTL